MRKYAYNLPVGADAMGAGALNRVDVEDFHGENESIGGATIWSTARAPWKVHPQGRCIAVGDTKRISERTGISFRQTRK